MQVRIQATDDQGQKVGGEVTVELPLGLQHMIHDCVDRRREIAAAMGIDGHYGWEHLKERAAVLVKGYERANVECARVQGGLRDLHYVLRSAGVSSTPEALAQALERLHTLERAGSLADERLRDVRATLARVREEGDDARNQVLTAGSADIQNRNALGEILGVTPGSLNTWEAIGRRVRMLIADRDGYLEEWQRLRDYADGRNVGWWKQEAERLRQIVTSYRDRLNVIESDGGVVGWRYHRDMVTMLERRIVDRDATIASHAARLAAQRKTITDFQRQAFEGRMPHN